MFAKFDEIPSMTKILRKLSLRITKEITPIVLAPCSKVFIICICLEDRSVFARFDEIPLMTL